MSMFLLFQGCQTLHAGKNLVLLITRGTVPGFRRNHDLSDSPLVVGRLVDTLAYSVSYGNAQSGFVDISPHSNGDLWINSGYSVVNVIREHESQIQGYSFLCLFFVATMAFGGGYIKGRWWDR